MSYYNKTDYKTYSGFWKFKKYYGVLKMAQKVYCSKCKSIEGAKSIFGDTSKIKCGNSNNMKKVVEETNILWYEEPKSWTEYDKQPSEINKNNNCPWFEAKEN
jgi:hypothetical protein